MATNVRAEDVDPVQVHEARPGQPPDDELNWQEQLIQRLGWRSRPYVSDFNAPPQRNSAYSNSW